MDLKNKYLIGTNILNGDIDYSKLKNSPFTFSNETNKNNECQFCNKSQISPKKEYYLNNSITSEIRIINLEKRLENAEKMLKFHEEIMRLKDEERKNEIRIDNNKLNEFGKKISSLDDSIKNITQRINNQNESFNDGFDKLDKKFVKINETKNSIGDFYSTKLSELEGLIRKNDIFVESLIDEKIANVYVNFDSKLEELLNLINEIGKSSEENEFNICESKENIKMIQNDHLNFIKILSILKEKADSLDYIMDQITEIKQKYGRMVQFYGDHSKEEDKFLNKILNN
jgi:hypothetical protein